MDEVYATFADFGLLQEDAGKKKQTGSASAVNQHAGTLNRFIQFGEVSRATRTAGNYGEGAVPAVSFALLANMHPEIAVPMERGEIGSHNGATKERILIYTAPRVQPRPIPD